MKDSDETMTISEALGVAARRLESAGVGQPRRESSSLLKYVLDRPAAFIIAHPEYALSESEALSFEEVVARRSAREPFQYIVGEQEFYGLRFEVRPGVLIPRPETELLVEAALTVLSPIEEPSFLEVGVGSGCVSISILHNLKRAVATAVDVSDRALILSESNARRHGVAERLALRSGNLFEGIDDRYHLIVSNPPYVPLRDLSDMQAEVARFEPHQALFGGTDGLVIIRELVSGAPKFLAPGGHLLIEIGHDQSRSVQSMLDENIWEMPEPLLDLQGFERVIKIRLRSSGFTA